MRAYLKIKMDRPFEKDKHYFSPGGYHIRTSDGREYGFDFNETQWGIDSCDPTVIEATLKDEDLDSFPEITELRDKLDQITEITDFYIYTGEYDEPMIYPVELLEFAINDTGTKYKPCPESTDFIEVHDMLLEKSKEYDSYDIDYVFKQLLLDQVTKIWKSEIEDAKKNNTYDV